MESSGKGTSSKVQASMGACEYYAHLQVVTLTGS